MGDPTKDENTPAEENEVETPDTQEDAETPDDGADKGDDAPENETPEERLARVEDELTRVREEAARRRVANRELKEQLAKAKTEDDIAEAVREYEEKVAVLEREILVRDVAAEFDLPPALRDRLRGDTAEELKADAKELAKLVPAARRFDEDDAGGGMDPSDEPDDFDEQVKTIVKRARRGR